MVNWADYEADCVFDACGCDQGGDCDCVCTALEAFAYACTSAGVPVKWRNQELCRKSTNFSYFLHQQGEVFTKHGFSR